MIWLGLSIATSSLLYVIFKYFAVYDVNRLHAIVFNYLIAFITGIIAYRGDFSIDEIMNAGWLPFSIGLGILFITIFNVMALTSQKSGLSVAAVASKMSLIIPVIAGVWLYEESLGWVKAVGLVVALISVVLSSLKKREDTKLNKSLLILPLLLFAGSGAIDTIIKYAETTFVSDGKEPLFSAVCFLSAFTVGVGILIYEAFSGRFIESKSIVAGIVLGIPNYFSIFFIIMALKTDMASSVVWPINHVGTVLLTSVLGIVLFRERMSVRNYLGVGLAIAAIVVIAFAKA